MRRLLLAFLALSLLQAPVGATTIALPKTWVTGDVLTASDLNTEFTTIANDYNGKISGANLDTTQVFTMAGTTLTSTTPAIKWTPTSGQTYHMGAEYAAATGTIWFLSNVTSAKHFLRVRSDGLFELPQYLSTKRLATGADGKLFDAGNTNLASDVTGTLAIANGGTGLTSLGDDAVRVGDSATSATARTLPNCTDVSGNHLNYTQSTNTFSCGTTSAGSVNHEAGSFTRDISLASGTQTVTLVGSFTPTSCEFNASINTTATVESLGFDDGTRTVNWRNYGLTTAGALAFSSTSSIFIVSSGANEYTGKISSTAAGSFVITWTKNNTPTGTATIIYLCHS